MLDWLTENNTHDAPVIHPPAATVNYQITGAKWTLYRDWLPSCTCSKPCKLYKLGVQLAGCLLFNHCVRG